MAVPNNQLGALKESIQFLEGIHDKFGKAQVKPSLLILDDLLNEVYSDTVLTCLRKAVITETSPSSSWHRTFSTKVESVEIFR